MVDAMRTWRCYLEGVSADMLTVVTDHNPLTYFHTQTVLSWRQTRWSEYLQMFEWLYRLGKNHVADPLSRNPGVVAALLPVARLSLCAGVLRCIALDPSNNSPSNEESLLRTASWLLLLL